MEIPLGEASLTRCCIGSPIESQLISVPDEPADKVLQCARCVPVYPRDAPVYRLFVVAGSCK